MSTAEPWHVWIKHPSWSSTSTTSPCTCCRTGKAFRSSRRSTTSRCASRSWARVSRQADRHRRSRLALDGRTRSSRRVDQQRSDVPASLPATRARRRLHLLRHGSVRSAVEGALRRRGRRVLGRVRRGSRAEVRVRRADRAHPAVADARCDLGRARRWCSLCFTYTVATRCPAAAACWPSSFTR